MTSCEVGLASRGALHRVCAMMLTRAVMPLTRALNSYTTEVSASNALLRHNLEVERLQKLIILLQKNGKDTSVQDGQLFTLLSNPVPGIAGQD